MGKKTPFDRKTPTSQRRERTNVSASEQEQNKCREEIKWNKKEMNYDPNAGTNVYNVIIININIVAVAVAAAA